MSTTHAPKNMSSLLDTRGPRMHATLECEACSELFGWDDGRDMLKAAMAAYFAHVCLAWIGDDNE